MQFLNLNIHKHRVKSLYLLLWYKFLLLCLYVNNISQFYDYIYLNQGFVYFLSLLEYESHHELEKNKLAGVVVIKDVRSNDKSRNFLIYQFTKIKSILNIPWHTPIGVSRDSVDLFLIFILLKWFFDFPFYVMLLYKHTRK